ncbi:MAG: type II/IV secretion system protein [Verrucomicrobia bacterium]|nr:type II/IV secretion system protein [Verrucomicrobiota bacterium]NBU07960.1 type II/IV secretion system protein [Pseudomonadota bacterium]NDA65686.1 type II/IV secretion system protein [Verrucomicrobiota bacterium]NDB74201.1 type II/IV secretion system protein [Verrucomicrobiota bacterium]NDD37184.1 type II/IV secretion system protein [Verrucomicrobiota bacterium]
MSQTTDYLHGLPTLLDADISTLVNYLVHDAVQSGASDIHIEPWQESLAVRIRVSGQLVEMVHLPSEMKDKVSGRFKVMANMASHLVGVAQDGKVNMGPEFNNVQLRVSIFPTVLGEKIVCRIFDPSTRTFDIDRLGLEPKTKEQFIHLVDKPNGLILLTGPTGSGKTTAIYCALHHLLTKHGTTVSVASVEDPVEVPIPTVSQAQLNPAQDFTFAAALRSLMRQDPQIIMVGEIRDPETAGIAVQAGLTGHLVISTVHSGTTAGVFARLINMGIEPFLLASSILGVMGVRLVRKNCPFCAIPYEPEPALLRTLTQEEIDNASFRKGAGCPECKETGYHGRFSISELLQVDEHIRDAVMEKKPTRIIQQIATDHGMRTLWQNGLNRALTGETTLEEVTRKVASDQI